MVQFVVKGTFMVPKYKTIKAIFVKINNKPLQCPPLQGLKACLVQRD